MLNMYTNKCMQRVTIDEYTVWHLVFSFYFIFQGTPQASDLAAFTGFVNATKKTKVIVHGFLDNGHSDWVTYAKDELLVKVQKCTSDF